MKNFAIYWTCLNTRRITNFVTRQVKIGPLTMKDELNGLILEEVVCLRSKLYSIKFSGVVKQSAEGVQRSGNHDLFQHVLSSGTSIHKKMTQMRSLTQLLVAQVNKVALSAFDDKRFFLDCGIKSLAYGHSSLQQKCNHFRLFHLFRLV